MLTKSHFNGTQIKAAQHGGASSYSSLLTTAPNRAFGLLPSWHMLGLWVPFGTRICVRGHKAAGGAPVIIISSSSFFWGLLSSRGQQPELLLTGQSPKRRFGHCDLLPVLVWTWWSSPPPPWVVAAAAAGWGLPSDGLRMIKRWGTLPSETINLEDGTQGPP